MHMQHATVHKRLALVLAVFVLVLVTGLTTMFSPEYPTAQAWAPQPGILPGSDNQAFWPDTAVDSGGMIHTVWHDVYWDATGSPVWYVRGQFNENGTAINWLSPVPLSQMIGVLANDGTAKIAVDANGTVHVVFLGTNNVMYYMYSPDNGVSWAAESFNIYERSWSITLDADDLGNPYVSWSNGVGDGDGKIWYTYRAAPGQWANPINLATGFLLRNNSIAATVIDGQPYVHLVYDYKAKDGSTYDVYYSRGQPASFSPPINFSGNYAGVSRADTTAITADEIVPGRLFASFVQGSVSSDFTLYFSTSADNGLSWPGFASLNLGVNIWPGLTSLLGYNNIGHIVTEEKYWDGDSFETIYIWYRYYNASNGQYSPNVQISAAEKSSIPSFSGGGSGKFAVWTTNNTEYVKFNFDVLEGGSVLPTATPTPVLPTATPTPDPSLPTATPTSPPPPTATPTPDKPAGSLQVENGAALVTKAETFVTFVLNYGKADQYKIWNGSDSEPSSFSSIPGGAISGPGGTYVVNPWTLYTSTDPEQNPCVNVTVNGKFKDSTTGKTSDLMSKMVVVDPGVDAEVKVHNPTVGASSYTSQLAYMLDVQARSSECSNLVQVQVGEQTTATQEEPTLQQATLGLMPLLPGLSADHTIIVEVKDGAGHTKTYERVITVDTQPPQLTSDNASLVAETSGSVHDSVEIDLAFANVTVSDDLYGTKAGEDRPFWGVWVANSRENIPLTESSRLESELNWQAVEIEGSYVQSGGGSSPYAFVVPKWNLYDGLAESEQTGGDYYVYARIMDGAGNLTTVVLQSNTINLSNTPQMPATPTPTVTPSPIPTAPPSSQANKVYLPMIVR